MTQLRDNTRLNGLKIIVIYMDSYDMDLYYPKVQ